MSTQPLMGIDTHYSYITIADSATTKNGCYTHKHIVQGELFLRHLWSSFFFVGALERAKSIRSGNRSQRTTTSAIFLRHPRKMLSAKSPATIYGTFCSYVIFSLKLQKLPEMRAMR